jgi:hypothetical protein
MSDFDLFHAKNKPPCNPERMIEDFEQPEKKERRFKNLIHHLPLLKLM